ncbi:MAG: diguanylate cyclase [Myxococcota bacterium]|nr:diguanylate cyclase [Myxococcota bacterium]
MGLRLKMGLAIAALVSSVLLVNGLVMIAEERVEKEAQLTERGIALLSSFSIPCAIAMANHDTAMLDDYLAGFVLHAREIDLDYVSIVDAERRVLSDTRPGRFQALEDGAFMKLAQKSTGPVSRSIEIEGRQRVEVAVPVISGLRWGTLVAGFRTERLETQIERKRAQLLLAGVGVAFLVCALAFGVLWKLVLVPVFRMRDMARRFGGGDLDARVIEEGRRDELGQLANQLNRMASQLQDYTEGLEDVVEARTQELAQSNLSLREANARLDELAHTDELTGLSNRRRFMQQLHFEVARGKRSLHQFGLLMIDLDHFKHYNDSHGHRQGDVLLAEIARLFRQILRTTDLVGRYGGEEFIVLLLDTTPSEGRIALSKLFAAIERAKFPFGEMQPLGAVTLSAGAAFYPDDGDSAELLIERADQALYRAKDEGRNCFRTWAETDDTDGME